MAMSEATKHLCFKPGRVLPRKWNVWNKLPSWIAPHTLADNSQTWAPQTLVNDSGTLETVRSPWNKMLFLRNGHVNSIKKYGYAQGIDFL